MPVQLTGDALTSRLVLLIIHGMSLDAAEAFCQQQGQTREQAAETVAAARKKITLAADFARDEQIGKAVRRLEDLYSKAVANKDHKTALQTQRELNRLLALYKGSDNDDVDTDDDAEAMRRQLDLISAYLLPLNITEAAYPVEEHARVCAEILRTHGLAKV